MYSAAGFRVAKGRSEEEAAGAAATWTNNLITGTTCYGHNATDSDPMMTRAGRPRTRKNELMPPPCKTEKSKGEDSPRVSSRQDTRRRSQDTRGAETR